MAEPQEIPMAKIGQYVATGTGPSNPATASMQPNEIVKLMNPTDEALVLRKVIDRFNAAKSYTQNIRPRWDEWYKYYRGFVADKDKKWVSNLFVPVAFTVVETLLPRVMAILFGPKFVVKILPREKNDIKLVRVIQQLLRFQFDRFKAFNKFYLWIKDCFMYGVGVVKVYWRFEAKERLVSEPKYLGIGDFRVKVGRQTVRKMVVDYDDPDIEVVDIYDFFVDPRATNLDDAKWCIQRVWRDYDYLKQKQKEGFYKNINLVRPGQADINDMDKQVRNDVGQGNTTFNPDDNFKVELLEYWEDGRVIVVANQQVIIRDDENPYWHGHKPFILIKDVEMPHEFYGVGEIEPIQSLINERNEIRNQRLDNVKSIVNRKIVADRNADIDFEHLDEDNRPGGIILTDDINKIKYLEEIDIVASAYNEDQMIVRDIQEATAMSETTIGVVPRRGETATAVNALQQAAASRFTLKIQSIVSGGILDLVKMVIQLDMQYLTTKRLVRIIGDDNAEVFAEIASEDISGNYDYEIQAGLLEVNKDIERQQWLMLAASPIFQKPNVNFEAFQKEILEKFDVEDPERFFIPMTPELRMAMAGGLMAGNGQTPNKPAGVGSIQGVPGTPPAAA